MSDEHTSESEEHPKKDFRDYIQDTYFMVGFYLGGRLFDSLSTLDFVTRLGAQYESNPYLRQMMTDHGALEGILLHNAVVTSVLIPAALLVNTLSERIFKENSFKAGNLFICGIAGAESYATALNNVIFSNVFY